MTAIAKPTVQEQTEHLDDLRNRLLDAVGGWQTAESGWPPTLAEIHAAAQVRALAAQLAASLESCRGYELRHGR